MRFADIIGNADVVRALRSMADSGRVAHAMLLYENEGSGALPIALAYLQYLNCAAPVGGDSCGECPSCRQMSKLIHPDVHFVFPVNKGPKSSDDKPVSDSYLKYWRELSCADPYFKEADLQKAIGIESKTGLIAVAEAKSLIGKLSLAAVADGYKGVIFYLPEKMNQETANRLLKLVEEPPEKTVFMFITHAPEKVLQTIFSRCQSVRIMPLGKDEAARVEAARPEGDREEYDMYMDLFSDLMNALVAKDLMTALECAETMAALDSREKQKGFCTFAADCIRKIFMIQQKMPDLAAVAPDEEEFYRGISSRVARTFCSKTIANIEKAVAMVERNVNSKIVFCDLVNRMFLTI
jgi:DNA polymerase-3 subunit delta'